MVEDFTNFVYNFKILLGIDLAFASKDHRRPAPAAELPAVAGHPPGR